MEDELIKQLKGDEGFRPKPYKDTVGKLTVGYGRNLDDVGISEGEAATLLWNDVNIAIHTLKVKLPWVTQLSEARLGVLTNMCFNLGFDTLSQFSKFLTYLKNDDFEGAAQEMEHSRWAQQVGARAQRLILQMRTDQWIYKV
jgi:lysozyme